MKKIFVFGMCNGGEGLYYALAEDGPGLGSHFCSNESFAKNDLGVIQGSRPDRHKDYKKHYPDGYEVVFVPSNEVKGNKELQRAIRLNEKKQRKKE